MIIPQGLSEEQVLTIINKVVSILAPQFKFGYFGIEDIKQEGSLYALEVLSKFNATRIVRAVSSAEKLETFLFTHVRNRLINLRRDCLGRNQPPCSGCQAFKAKCHAFEDTTECPRIIKWKKRNEIKKNLVENSSLENEDVVDDTSILRNEFVNLIDSKLPIAFRADYRRFIEGNRLPKRRQLKLIEEIKCILGEINEP